MKAEKILKECLGENSIDNQKIRYSVYKAMEKYAEQKQTNIDELVEFIDNNALKLGVIAQLKAIKLIQKHTKK